MSTPTGTQKCISVRMFANVLWRGALLLGMRLFRKRSAAMLRQNRFLSNGAVLRIRARRVAASLQEGLAGPDAGGEAADGSEVKIFVELDRGAVLRGNREGKFA